MTETQNPNANRYADSPYKPLWERKTQSGKTKYVGVAEINGQEYWLNVYPNVNKRNPKAPDFTFSMDKKESQ